MQKTKCVRERRDSNGEQLYSKSFEGYPEDEIYRIEGSAVYAYMQIRLAMELHNTQVQADLEKQLEEVTEQIDHFI